MNIYIMTRGRVGKQHTWRALPPALKERTYIVCPVEEYSQHGIVGGIPQDHVIPAPVWVKNYSDKFKWILEDGMNDTHNRCVIVDDDLKFSVPVIRKDGKRRLCTLVDEDPSIEIGFAFMEYLLHKTALVSFHPRQMGHTKEPPYVENGKVVCVQGINRELVGDIPDLNRFPILADVVLNATLLSRGIGNKLITNMFVDWYPCQAPGGCSLTRTAEIQAEACYWLEERFGPYIKAVEKEAKNGWLGGKRVDFRGQWKKLYEAGVAGILDQRTRDNQEVERAQ